MKSKLKSSGLMFTLLACLTFIGYSVSTNAAVESVDSSDQVSSPFEVGETGVLDKSEVEIEKNNSESICEVTVNNKVSQPWYEEYAAKAAAIGCSVGRAIWPWSQEDKTASLN